jgi:predicted P-loop ATPase
MAIECRLAGLNTWDKDISRYIHSSYITEYNPVWEYLSECRDKWDGKDRIRELARRVPTKNPYWPDWFYTWFLGMVRQWQSSIYDRYGNQIAPLLISKQGWNKSTFIQSLLPPELQWGFTNQLDVSEKRQTLQAMSQFLLINLDEFNQISPQLQQGFLKNVITLPCVKVKRPYGKHVEPFPRMASFIGATNQADVLTDPSGGRRFLGIELTGPIDISHNINYEQIFAQALYALDHHELYYFNDEQTQQILESNREFQQLTPAEQYFNDCFEPAMSENDGKYLTSSAIFAHIKKIAGSDLRLNSLNHFGRTLSNIPNLKRKRTTKGTEYLVKLRK